MNEVWLDKRLNYGKLQVHTTWLYKTAQPQGRPPSASVPLTVSFMPLVDSIALAHSTMLQTVIN